MKYSFAIAAADQCANTLSRFRNEAGLSRKEMSEVMGVSETTIRAWENGQGAPTLPGMLIWLRATGNNAARPLVKLLCQEQFGNVSIHSHESEIRELLAHYFRCLAGGEETAKVHYLMFGDHGLEWSGLLDMALAHVNASLDSRCRVAETIQTSYSLSEAAGQLREPAGLSVNRELIDRAKNAAWQAVARKRRGYTMVPEEAERISQILARSRLDAGVTQQEMAKALGKTTRTVQNWEAGSSLSFLELQLWFHALDLPPWPYVRTLLYPGAALRDPMDSPAERERIAAYVRACPEESLKKLAYLMGGGHGSDWYAVLELMFAYLCEPLSQRILSAQAILLGYTLDSQSRKHRPDAWALPNLDNLKCCIDRSLQSILKKRDPAA